MENTIKITPIDDIPGVAGFVAERANKYAVFTEPRDIPAFITNTQEAKEEINNEKNY